jgi:hypothetical protein
MIPTVITQICIECGTPFQMPNGFGRTERCKPCRNAQREAILRRRAENVERRRRDRVLVEVTFEIDETGMVSRRVTTRTGALGRAQDPT